ncbi:hypothetical protein C8F04DRAFT_82897 [Mycena alexandri]|uniref:Uncharacterized protein n=1 Tax=Mycena alexandri TaxID=1745969 RepID=A0AAD6TAL2_9AGAR|nr:hypothetical protein C8F04DRAFT_82897 [Mycena alexandri]
MDIEFSPPLGETVHCHVSSSKTRQQSSSVRLHFTATLSNVALQVASGSARLQVWSDIPGNGRHSGEWGETDFRLLPPLPVNEDAAFSVLPDNDSDVAEPNITLTADFVLPTSHGQRFSFTYRMLYPSGEIKWLGQYGQNGTLVLELDSDPVVLLEKDSWVSADNQVYRRDSDGRAVQDLEVAKLIRPHEYYIAYLAGEDSFLHPKTSPVLLLVPRLSAHPVIVPPTLIFAVPSGSSGSLSFTRRDGTITISGTPSLTFTTYDSESVVEAISAVETTGINGRVIAHSPGHVVVASTPNVTSNDTATAVEMAVVPIFEGASSHRAIQSTVPLRTLASFLPGENPDFFMFEPRYRRARFFPSPELESGEGVLYLTTAPSGGRFVLAPALYMVAHGGAQWRVGVVTSAPESNSSNSKSALLPTPPPSPRLRPLPHRVSESAGGGNNTTADQSPDPSFLSLPAAIASSDEHAPGETGDESESLAGSQQQQLIVHPNSASKRHAGVLNMLGRVFVLLIAWVTRLFGGAGFDKSERRRDERTPLLRDAPERESGYVEPSPSRVEVVVSTPEQGLSGEQPVSFDVSAGKTTLLFKTTHPTAAAGFNVPISLDGRALELDVLKLEEKGVFVVEFKSTGGGRVRVG